MKNLYKLSTLTVGLLALPAYEADRGSNPVLSEPDMFVPNVPALASSNVYNLRNSESLELICTQPDYGILIAVTYSVQTSLEENFVDAHTEISMETNYTTLGTIYSSVKMEVKALESVLTLRDLRSVSPDEESSTAPIPVYARLKAELTNNSRGTAFLDVIELPKVLGYKAIPPPELPSNIFINDSMVGSNWSNRVPLAAVSGMSKLFGLSHFGDIDMFKLGTKEGEYIGFDDLRLTIASNVFIGSDDRLGGQNISVDITSWYTVIMSVSIKGIDYTFTLDITSGEVYLIGNAIKDWTFGDKGKPQVPTTVDTDFASPVCTGGGELRMSVKTPREGWWHMEPAIPNGKIVFHENKSVINSWSEIDPGYVINVKAGQKINLNSIQKTGSVTQ